MRKSRRFMDTFYGFYALLILVSLVIIARFRPSNLVATAVILLGLGVLVSISANRRKNYLSRDMLIEYTIVGLAVLVVLISAVRK